MKLIEPDEKLIKKLSIFLSDIKENDPDRYFVYEKSEIGLEQYIELLLNQKKGNGLPKGYSPCSHFWLIDDSANILGAIRIRHDIESKYLSEECGHIGYDIAPKYRKNGLGKLILKLGLHEAKKLNIEDVLITADEDNIASRKVIESNGCAYESTIVGEISGLTIARYWAKT